MTHAAFTLDASLSSDATFRSWGSAISAQLAAVGLVQTADTGQANWSTITRPSTNSDGGYEVWRFADSLQATAPVFVKLYYGIGSNAAGPRLRVEVGTASNGSGTLSGTGSGTVHSVLAASAAGPTGIASWMSSDGSGFCFAHQPETTTTSARSVFVVDRFRNASGVAQGSGFGVLWVTNGTFAGFTVDTANAATDSRTAAPAVLPAYTALDATGRSALTRDGELFVYPGLFSSAAGVHYSKMLGIFWGRDAGVSAILDLADHLGADRVYRFLGASYFSLAGGAGGSFFAPATWWED